MLLIGGVVKAREESDMKVCMTCKMLRDGEEKEEKKEQSTDPRDSRLNLCVSVD